MVYNHYSSQVLQIVPRRTGVKMKKFFLNIFDKNADTAVKNQSLQEKIMLVLTFIVVPVASILITLVASDRPVSTSMSRIAWVDKKFVFVLLWGLLNMGNYIYSMVLTVKKGGYSKGWKKFFIVSASVAAAIMTIGLSIPAYYSETDVKLQQMRTAHVIISGAGFFYYVAEVFFVALTLLWRNKNQFFLSIGMACFIAIGGIFSLIYVNDPTGYCFCSTATQLFLFGASNFFLAVQYFLMRYFPMESNEKTERS